MNISKKRLRERLLDICLGAGMYWQDGDGYFERDDDLESIGRAIQAIEKAFEISGSESIIRLPWNLGRFENIDDLTDFVASAIELREGV